MQGQKALGFHQKYLNLCSEDERRSYGFGTTWGWVIKDRIFGWSIPLTDRMTTLLEQNRCPTGSQRNPCQHKHVYTPVLLRGHTEMTSPPRPPSYEFLHLTDFLFLSVHLKRTHALQEQTLSSCMLLLQKQANAMFPANSVKHGSQSCRVCAAWAVCWVCSYMSILLNSGSSSWMLHVSTHLSSQVSNTLMRTLIILSYMSVFTFFPPCS